EVLRLQPVKFRRIEHKRGSDFAPNGKPLPPMRERREVGFIAQDVQAVLPDAVVDIAGEDEEPLLAMTYDTITVALVAAVQTLNARLAALEGRRK
ncbi:MAG TPA: tail fiber domain-containing protein, partial [Candidatus Dormibacteraeota bacterium]|nr:tail fiber domain-containing protein [Candidatus Dormibacteraeota bacterium]